VTEVKRDVGLSNGKYRFREAETERGEGQRDMPKDRHIPKEKRRKCVIEDKFESECYLLICQVSDKSRN
jgi:hypothetical protein